MFLYDSEQFVFSWEPGTLFEGFAITYLITIVYTLNQFLQVSLSFLFNGKNHWTKKDYEILTWECFFLENKTISKMNLKNNKIHAKKCRKRSMYEYEGVRIVPVVIFIDEFNCASIFDLWALFIQTGNQYKPQKNQGYSCCSVYASAPHKVPTSSCIKLFLVLNFKRGSSRW